MKSEIDDLGCLYFLRSAHDEDLQRLFEIVLTTNDIDGPLNHPSLDIGSCGSLSILKDGVLDTHEKMLHKVVNELRLQSVSRFENLLHGEGPDYPEILRNVADKLTVPYSGKESDSEIEIRILRQLSSKAVVNHDCRRECDLHEVVQSITGMYVVTPVQPDKISTQPNLQKWLWLVIDSSGPEYRVTIPAVIQIAYIRNKLNCNNHVGISATENM